MPSSIAESNESQNFWLPLKNTQDKGKVPTDIAPESTQQTIAWGKHVVEKHIPRSRVDSTVDV